MQRSAKVSPKNNSPSNRQLRVAELVRRNLSETFARTELYEQAETNLPIIVSEVRCSSDLKLATVFIIPLGGKDAQKVVKSLAKHKGIIRKSLGKKLHMKFVPDLRFFADKSLDQMDKTAKLLNSATVQHDISN